MGNKYRSGIPAYSFPVNVNSEVHRHLTRFKRLKLPRILTRHYPRQKVWQKPWQPVASQPVTITFSMRPMHPLAGKTVHLMRDIRAIGINSDGELLEGGRTMRFGMDYILTEGDSDEYLRIFDYEGHLRHILNL